MAKSPIFLHSEQETSQVEQPRPFDRQKNEPSKWFLRFRNYCLMGRGRSVQAIYEQERQAEKAPEGTKNDAEKKREDTPSSQERVKVSISVPGSWKRASVQWRWKERATAWDEDVRIERHKQLLSYLDHEAQYVTRAQRINGLDILMSGLLGEMLKEHVVKHEFQIYLACIRQLQSILRDIRKEMADFDKSGAQSMTEAYERFFL